LLQVLRSWKHLSSTSARGFNSTRAAQAYPHALPAV
jgi:hypothetical protein